MTSGDVGASTYDKEPSYRTSEVDKMVGGVQHLVVKKFTGGDPSCFNQTWGVLQPP